MSGEEKITLNLRQQFESICRSWLQSVDMKQASVLNDPILQYLNLKWRLVNSVSRNVYYSKEFYCPVNLQDGLNQVKEKIEKGEDITPYLSKSIKNVEYNDMMLNDWGIHHLHLGTTTDKKDSFFVNRTGKILYVKFEKNKAYLIQIMEHNEWTNDNLIKIIHDNWPDLIAKYKLKGMDIDQKFTDKERQKLRNGGTTSPVKVGDISYFPLGLGYATNKQSNVVIEKKDQIVWNLNKLEKDITENFRTYYKEKIRESTDYKGDSFEFELEIRESDNETVITETKSNVSFCFGNYRNMLCGEQDG